MCDVTFDLMPGGGPLIATAIHHGHELRPEVREHMALGDAERLREEDPFTGIWTEVAPTSVIARQSRFEMDLNRPPEKAVYRKPEDAWGLSVWKGELPDDVAGRSLANHGAFYETMNGLYRDLLSQHERLVVLDIHSYNHRREGPGGRPADHAGNPQVNVGTGTLLDRQPWESLIQRFIHELRAFDFPGGRLDVRENVKFTGGYLGRWSHTAFANSVCVLSIEFKKFFMDEWTGVPDPALIQAISAALSSTVPGILTEMGRHP